MGKDFIFGVALLVIVAICVVITIVLPTFKKKPQPTDPDSYKDQQANAQAFAASNQFSGSDSGS